MSLVESLRSSQNEPCVTVPGKKSPVRPIIQVLSQTHDRPTPIRKSPTYAYDITHAILVSGMKKRHKLRVVGCV
ncbi:uncharacterized protein K452DRAFT_288962 [Aplosporella prunicola CBS 121167]|uniref:Uncharacterized protein n=1 Tax=Aplosporella prunicola CBS 121167 TaxID=1176127 RepID=A0A6A6B7M7_9PEZI|nr:uncharacterized protein K452DRAFT_288962 [Aplosporella prunicola CBS 121167]KAF2140192.1 hypothetical protein K452DRAFT_288962 [Aplosporella prunicola CBS 121167]